MFSFGYCFSATPRKVGGILGRCVDEVKLIAFERQLEDDEDCRALVAGEFDAGRGCLEAWLLLNKISVFFSLLGCLHH